MNWAQLTAENAFLILSILSGTGAAAVLLQGIVRSKLRNVSQASPTLPGQLHSELANSQRRPSLLDRITLLNRNLIQCPKCFMIEYANARFCTRCAMPMQRSSELPQVSMQGVEAQYLLQDGPNRLFGLSMRLDPKTRIGIIIGIQNQETPERVNEAQNWVPRYTEPNPARTIKVQENGT